MRAGPVILLTGWFFGRACSVAAQSPLPAADSQVKTQATTGEYVLNLAAVLRLSNARNLDVEIARERIAEAKALHEGAVTQFFPWLSPGISYRRHDDLIQDVAGNIIEVHKQSYAPGATLAAQVDVGDALFKSLVSRQQLNAATHAAEAQRQVSAFTAAQLYFDLLLAQAAVGVAREAVNISSNYAAQVKGAVEAGLVFKGDELRVQVEREKNELALRRSQEKQRVVSARLAEALHLDPAVILLGQYLELIPLRLADTNAALGTLVARALVSRPETRQDHALLAAARESRKGAVYGPLIPTASAQFFAGGLGGDSDAGSSRFGSQEDIFAGLSWRIGPGGLFDFSRTRVAAARLKTAELTATKREDAITREVVEAFARVQSLGDQMTFAKRGLEAAEAGLRLTQLRREFAIGVVLENIQAERDLTSARLDYATAIAEFNKAQYGLGKAVGGLGEPAETRER